MPSTGANSSSRNIDNRPSAANRRRCTQPAVIGIERLDQLRRQLRGRLEHQGRDQLAASVDSGSSASARPAAASPSRARRLRGDRVRALELLVRERAAPREVAIAVEVAPGRASPSSRAVGRALGSSRERRDAQRVELGRRSSRSAARRVAGVAAAVVSVLASAAVAARMQRLAGEDLEQDRAERVDVGRPPTTSSPRTCSGAM